MRSKSSLGQVIPTYGKRYECTVHAKFHSTYNFLKAALCALRVVKKVPELADHFTSKSKNLLTDRNHGVLLTSITLVTEMCQTDSAILEEFRNVRLIIPK